MYVSLTDVRMVFHADPGAGATKILRDCRLLYQGKRMSSYPVGRLDHVFGQPRGQTDYQLVLDIHLRYAPFPQINTIGGYSAPDP